MARVSSEVREVAREISAVKRGLRGATATPQLGRSSLDDDSINTYDSDGNLRARYGLQHDGTYTSAVLDGPVPPVPSVPTVSGGPGELSVTWDGTYVDDARAPMDFHVVEVWAADTDFSDRSEARLLGHFANESGGDITVARPVGEWHVALVSKAQSGRRSAVSGRAVAVVESVVDQGVIDDLNEKLDGLPSVTWSTRVPTPTDGDGKPDHATWRQIDPATDAIIGEWVWGNAAGEWVFVPIADDAVYSLDVGKLVASQLGVDEAGANEIWAAKIAASKIDAEEINTQSLGADAGFIGVLNSAEIVGAVIKTAESGTRVELDSGHGIRIFSDDTEVFNIDSSTGGIAMRGGLFYGDSDGAMLVVGESAQKWGSYMPGIRFGGYGQGISEQSPALRGDINEIELVGGPAWIRIEHGLQNPYISVGVENPALSIHEDAVYLPLGANIFPTTYERDIGLTNPPDGTQAWTGSGNNLQEWIRVNGAWERKTPHGWTQTNLDTYVATSFGTRDLMGYTDGHTVVIRGLLGGGNITQGGMDITRTAIPTNLRPGPGNWQGACWVNGGHPAVAFVRENGTISVVQRSGGNVSGAQFVITYPRI